VRVFRAAADGDVMTAGVEFASLASAASTARGRRAAPCGDAGAHSKLDAAVNWRNTPGRGIEIEMTVSGASRYAVYYRALSPWTTDAGDMPRLDVLGSSAMLPLSPSRNERVLAVIEVDDEILDCPVRVLAERLQFR
jgi:hypothetical protein